MRRRSQGAQRNRCAAGASLFGGRRAWCHTLRIDMNPPTICCVLVCLSLSPLLAGAQSATSHRPATAPQTHHPVEHVPHCPVPAPQLSAKIPPTPATLGCPKIEYALTYLDTKIGTGELAQPHKWY